MSFFIKYKLYIKNLLPIVISFFALITSINSCQKSKESNEIAKAANEIAKEISDKTIIPQLNLNRIETKKIYSQFNPTQYEKEGLRINIEGNPIRRMPFLIFNNYYCIKGYIATKQHPLDRITHTWYIPCEGTTRIATTKKILNLTGDIQDIMFVSNKYFSSPENNPRINFFNHIFFATSELSEYEIFFEITKIHLINMYYQDLYGKEYNQYFIKTVEVNLIENSEEITKRSYESKNKIIKENIYPFSTSYSDMEYFWEKIFFDDINKTKFATPRLLKWFWKPNININLLNKKDNNSLTEEQIKHIETYLNSINDATLRQKN